MHTHPKAWPSESDRPGDIASYGVTLGKLFNLPSSPGRSGQGCSDCWVVVKIHYLDIFIDY